MIDSRESEISLFKQSNTSHLSHTQASPYQHQIQTSHSADPSKLGIQKVKIPLFVSEKKSDKEIISKELPEANPLLFGSGIENVSFFQPTQSLYPLDLHGQEGQKEISLKKSLQQLDCFSEIPLESTKDISLNIPLQQLQQTPQQPCQLLYKKQEKQLTVNLTTLKTTLNSKSSPIISQFYSSNSSNLQFESRFESGNLASVSKFEHNVYSLIIQQDVNTRGYTQWFYFKVTNQKREQNVKFILGKFYKKNSLFQQGMQISVLSQRLQESEGIAWHKSGDNIRYYSEEELRIKNNYNCNKISEQYINQSNQSEPLNFELNNFMNEQTTKNNKNNINNEPNNQNNLENQTIPLKQSYLLEFEYSFERENDTTYFAYSVPYTYQHLQKYLQTLISKSYESLTIRPLCSSLLGNDLYILTITNPKTPLGRLKDSQKKGIFLTARVHPGETVSSFIAEGFINFLLGQTKEAMVLKDQFVFKIVPMLNPDGVVVGNYRCSIAGCDLNRRWMNPSEELQPEIFYVKKALFEYNSKYPVVAYCDLHGHSKKQGFFVYGCQEDKGKEDNDKEFTARSSQVMELPYLIGKLTSWFETVNCKYSMTKSKESTSRQTVFRELQVPESFTMEASFFGPVKKFDCQSASIQFIEDDYRHMGECLGKSLYQKFGPQNEEYLGEFRKENMQLRDNDSEILSKNNILNDLSSGSDSDPSGDNLDAKELGLLLPVEKPKKKKKKAALTGIRRLLMTSYYSHSPPRVSNKQEGKEQSNSKEKSKANKQQQQHDSSSVEKYPPKNIFNSTHNKFNHKETNKDGSKIGNQITKKNDNKICNNILKVSNQHKIVSKDKFPKEIYFDELNEQEQQQHSFYVSSPTLNPVKLKIAKPTTDNYNFKMLGNDSLYPKIVVNCAENDAQNVSNIINIDNNRNNNILNFNNTQNNISALSESKSFMIASSIVSMKSTPKKYFITRKKSNLQMDESMDNSQIKQIIPAVYNDFIENSLGQIKGNSMENSRSQNQEFLPQDSVLLHTKQRALSDSSKKCCSPIHASFQTVPVNRSKVIDLSGSQQSESLQQQHIKVLNKQQQIFQQNQMIQQGYLDYGNYNSLLGDITPRRIISQTITAHFNDGKAYKQQENSDDQVRRLLSKMNSTKRDITYVQSKINKLNEIQIRCKTDGDINDTPSNFRNHFNNHSTMIQNDQRFDETGDFQRTCSSNHAEHMLNETSVQLCRKTRSYSYKPKQSFISNLQKIRSGQVACNKNLNNCLLEQQFVSYKIPNVRFSEQKQNKKLEQNCPFSAKEQMNSQFCANKKQSISSSRPLMIKSIKLKTPQLRNLSPGFVKLVSPHLVNCLQEMMPQMNHHGVAQSSSSFNKNRERSISNSKAAGNGIKDMNSLLKLK